MITKKYFKRCARMQRDFRNRLAAALLLTGAVLTGLGWTAESWAQANLPHVGILTFSAVSDVPRLGHWVDLFRRNLADHGWIDGKTVSFEYRSARGDPSQMAEAATELVGLNVDVIWASSAPSLRAAYAATRTIPIVGWDLTTDPVTEGYVESYARPGGNVTGVFLDAPEFAGKWFELLNAMIPELSRAAVLWDPGTGVTHLQAVRSVARSLDVKLKVLEVRRPEDIDHAFEAMRGQRLPVILLPSPLSYGPVAQLARLAKQHRLPATSVSRDFAIAGGLIAYGPDAPSANERVAVLVAKILDGKKPFELPAERPTTFHLVVNLKTAKTLGLTIPQSILLRADEVIE